MSFAKGRWCLVAVAGLAACQKPMVTPLDSPAGANSATKSHGGSSRSGASKLAAQRAARHGAGIPVLSAGVWSKPIEVARGEDWFVNWADFL